MSDKIESLDQKRQRRERWRHHSAKEREALNDLAVAIERYLTQVSPGNINNAAFVERALPHVETMKRLFATAKRMRLRMLENTLRVTARAANPNERELWELYATAAQLAWMNRV